MILAPDGSNNLNQYACEVHADLGEKEREVRIKVCRKASTAYRQIQDISYKV